MKLYLYRGLYNESVPELVTHVIVDCSVTVIKKFAFGNCGRLVSVVMTDNVKRIEEWAFCYSRALRFIRLSKTLEYIGQGAFQYCESLEALFLPSTLKYIEYWAFYQCGSLRLLILPNDIDLSNVGHEIIHDTGIHQIAEMMGVEYEFDEDADDNTYQSNSQVNEWLFHHMDESQFHKLCYNSSVTTTKINDYLNENGNDTALQIDTIHGMIPLHMLSMNPHAPADAIAALLNSNMEAIMCLDSHQKGPLEYARDYNVDGLIRMIAILCNHRNSSVLVEMNVDNESKRRRIE